MAAGAPSWRPGDDLDAAIARWQRVPLAAGGFRLFSAHQMGTCRMGNDAADERRRTRGASCTTRRASGSATRAPSRPSSGTNPMITIMALAHRTAEAIAAARTGLLRPSKPQRPKGETNGSSNRDPGTRQALHRRRVGRPHRLRDDRGRQLDDRGGDRPHPAGHAARTWTGRSRPRGEAFETLVADEPDGARRLDAPDRGRARRARRGDRGADLAGARHAAPAVAFRSRPGCRR